VEYVICDPANDSELLLRAMYGYTPNADGKYCRNRATSYCLGTYGLDFVCHQNGNAFMNHRRGYEPVSHWYTWPLYGSHGNQGISSCSNWKGQAMHGCIPGNWCEGNHIPYTNPEGEVISLAVEFAPGDGYGLESVWNARKSSWIWSEARFNSAPITIPGKDDYPETLSTEDLPIQ
jgi:hypothetical protein